MKIKLLFGVAAVAAVMAQAVCANAAYDQTGNSYTAENEAGYKTVIIVKGTSTTATTEDDLYYIDQNTSGFAASAQFFMKDNPTAGTYTMYMGGGSGDIRVEEFKVTAASGSTDVDVPMGKGTAALNEDGSYNISFTVNYTGGNTPSSIKVTGIKGTESTYIYYINSWPIISGNGSTSYAVQIDNVPAAYRDSISVSLSNRTQTSE